MECTKNESHSFLQNFEEHNKNSLREYVEGGVMGIAAARGMCGNFHEEVLSNFVYALLAFLFNRNI